MVKRCIVCDTNANYKIKDTSDYYCEVCAKENFSDLNLLLTIEEEAQRLKEYIKEKLEEEKIEENLIKEKLETKQEEE